MRVHPRFFLIALLCVFVLPISSHSQGLNPDAVYPIPVNAGSVLSGGINLFTGSINDTLTLATISARTFKYNLQTLYNSRTAGVVAANPSNYVFTPLGGYGWKLLDYPKIVQDGSSAYLLDGYGTYRLEQLSGSQPNAYTPGGKFYLWKVLQSTVGGGTSWTILTEDGKHYVFDSPGISIGSNRTLWNFSKFQELQWKDSLTFVYSATGTLVLIANTLGDTLVFQYDTVATSANKYLKSIAHRRVGGVVDNIVLSYDETIPGPAASNYYLLSEVKTIQQIAPQIYAEKGSGTKFSYMNQGSAIPLGGDRYIGGLMRKVIPSGGVTTFSYIATKGGVPGNPTNYSVAQYAVNVGYENTSGDTLDSNTYTAIEYDSTNVTLDSTGTYFQYNYARIMPGGRAFTTDTVKAHPYGNTEYYLFNGLPPSRLWDFPAGFDSAAVVSGTLHGYTYKTLINSDTTVHDRNFENASVVNYWNEGYVDSAQGYRGGYPRLDRTYNELYGIGEWTAYRYGPYGLPIAVYTSRRNPEPNNPLLNKDSLATIISYAFQQYPSLASDSLHILNVPARVLNLVQEDLQGPFIPTNCECTQWTQWDKRGNPSAAQGVWASWRTVAMRDSSANPDSCFTAGNSGTTNQWLVKNLVNKRYPGGAVADNTDGSGMVSSTFYSSREYGDYPVASFTNATIDSIKGGKPPSAGYYGFEPYEGPGSIGWSMGQGSQVKSTYAHTGANSFSGSIKRTFFPALNAPRTFIFSGWCWVAADGDSCNLSIYNMQSQKLASRTVVYGMGTPVWSYVEITVIVQPGSGVIPYATASGGGLIDDIRFAPIDAPFSALVSDMDRKIVTAELGTNGETTYLVHNRFDEQVALVGPGSDGQIQNMMVPYNSRAGARFITGVDSFDTAYPNMQLNITARKGGRWDGFQYRTSTNFPPANLVNMQIVNQWLVASGSPASATYAGSISTSNFSIYAELTPNSLTAGQETGLSLQVDSLYDQDSVITTYELKFVVTANSVKLYSPYGTYALTPLASVPNSTSLLLAVINNTVYGYMNGRYLFEHTFLLGAIHGPAKLISTNIGGSFDNFLYVESPYVVQQTFDALNSPRQQLGRVNEYDLHVSEILYGGPLNLPVAQTRSALIGGDNTANSGMSYRPSFASGFNYDSMTVGKTSVIASASGYSNPFSHSVRYGSSPLLQIAMVGGGGDFTAGEKGNHYSTFTYGVDQGGIFDYSAEELLTTTRTHPNGAQHVSFMNREGVLFAEAHIAGTDTLRAQYEYDRAIRLVRTYQPNYYDTTIAGRSSFTITRNYDFLGNKTVERTPDSGIWQFIYSPAGDLRFMMDANGSAASPDTIVYVKYDRLRRVVEEGIVPMQWNRDTLQRYADTNDSWPNSAGWIKRYIYDGMGLAPNKGRLTSVLTNADQDSLPEVAQWFKYDVYGHITEVSLKAVDFDTLTRTVRYEYDLLGNISRISFPGTANPDRIFTRNELGQLTAIGIPGDPDYYASYSYEDGGMSETLNNQGFTRNYTYLNTGWLSAVDDPFFNQRLTYLHHDTTDQSAHYDGNISQITDQLFWNNQVLNASFRYDQSGRLAVADLGATNPWSLGLRNPTAYDKNGNIGLLQLGQNPPYDFLYTAGTNRLRTLQGFSQNYGYDPNGSITSAPFTLTSIRYNPLTNRTNSVLTRSNQFLGYQYGGADQRVLKSARNPGGKASQTLYVHGLNDYPLMEITKDTLGTSSTVFYVYGPTGLIALGQDSLRFAIVKDHLGSVRAVVDTANMVRASFNYSAFGNLMSSIVDSGISRIPLRYRYTGQEYDVETGLYNYRARLYDPGIGRFYSPDPMLQFPSPYLYGGNNPISFVDPTGMWSFWSVVGVVAAVVAVVAVVVVIAVVVAAVAAPAALAAVAVAAGVSASTIVSAAVGVGVVATSVVQMSIIAASAPTRDQGMIHRPPERPGGGTMTPPQPPIDATKDKSRRYDQYTYLTAHNAFATSADGWIYAQQSLSMTEQMNRGVRALMLDIHPDSCYHANRCAGPCADCPQGNIVDVYLCHGNCGIACDIAKYLQPFQRFTRLDQGLGEVRTFLNRNKNEVMTIIFESCVGDSHLVKQNIRRSGIDQNIFYPDGTPMRTSKGTVVRWNVRDSIRLGGQSWPTQQWMIDNGLRVVLFTSRRNDFLPFQWDYTVENRFSDQNIWSGSHFQMIPCVNRGESGPLSDTTRMFVFNHFPIFDPGMLPLPAVTYLIINDYYNIMGRIEGNCLTAARRIPNFVATDFVQYGDNGGPRKVVDDLNKKWYIKIHGPVLP